MDDFQVLSFTDLLSQCLKRCVVDWRCFCYRQVKDESYVDSQARSGLIQFARAQREIFLKLYLVHQFMREQRKLDKVLQRIHFFETYLDNCGRDLALNLRKIPLDLVEPCPNTAVAVDLLANGRYTRMPAMLPQLAEAAETNSVALPPLNDEEADMTMDRIYMEYRCQFRLSECRKKHVKMEFRNAQCVLIREGMFSVTLIYDFCSWQALGAVPLLLERLGCSTDGEARSSFFALIMYAVAIYNMENQGNVFDAVFNCANVYAGKILMERLKAQATDYRSLKLTVTDYRFYVSTDPDFTLLSCSDVTLSGSDLLVLEVSAFPGFKEDKVEGLTLTFQMDASGNVSVQIGELPELLSDVNITEHRLGQWLDLAASRLERYQLDNMGVTGNFFMNYATGALHLSGLPVSFSLIESQQLLRVMRVRETLITAGYDDMPTDAVSRESLREIWKNEECPECSSSASTGEGLVAPAVILSVPLREHVCDFWAYLEEKAGAIHGSAAYRLDCEGDLGDNLDAGIYLTVLTHDERIVANTIVIVVSGRPQGVIKLTRDFSEYYYVHSMLLGFARVVTPLAVFCGFETCPLSPDDIHMVATLEDVEITVDSSGYCESVTHNHHTARYASSEEAVEALYDIMRLKYG
ncbi:cloroquine resistance associated protein Cg2, putative [Babesia caballi]|uniref:Mediator of RNA polymerase II transcription subunit 14 n=1 Tax=Babesia caballi TaxID=5871 RepID=A0AAV4LN46_BABCB|nr:cloroquine resistance associated protein Cg2, putative [Babesia caballi]